MSTTPPGWYDDGHGALRWWDGAAWTEHVAQPDPEPEPAAAENDEVLPPELAAELDPAAASSVGVPAPGEVPGYAAYGAGGQQPYPGAEGAYPAGAFTSATAPKKSRAWIIWLVAGLVLLGIVIAAAVLIPLLILGASTGGGGQPQQPSSSTFDVDDSVVLSTDDDFAVVDTVALYDRAWQNADCDDYLASTTADFRESGGYTDCAEFEADAAATAESLDDYAVLVTTVSFDSDTALVITTETYSSMYDEQGRLTDERIDYEDYLYYLLVSVDGEWLIDGVEIE